MAQVQSSPGERRLHAEWNLLTEMIARNPERLGDASTQDTTFEVLLRGTPALPVGGGPAEATHKLRIVYPRFFPAVPLEMYVGRPLAHPNIHPETGFLCLWDRHRVSNTVEHALHKTVAMLGWRLLNLDPRHTMQADSAALGDVDRAALALRLEAAPLRGVEFPSGSLPEPAFRRRLT